MKFFASRSSPARQLRIFKFFPSSDIQSYPVYIQSFPIHPAIAWCLIPGEGFKYKWSAGTFRYATPISALHWRLEDISKKRHSRVCSCWPSSTCMQFVLFLFIYKANTTSSAIWIWGPDSDKMTGTVVLRNGCRSTLWWTVFGRQEWWHLCFRRRKYWRWVIWSNRKVIAACDISAVQFEPTGNEWIALTAAKPSELCNVTVDCNVPRSCYLAQHVPRVPGIETRLNPTGTGWLQFQVLLVLLLKTYENRMCCPKNPIFHEFFQLPTGDWPKIPSDLLWLTLQRQRLHNAIPCSMSRLFCKVCLAQTYQLCNLNQLVMNELH